jgi:hypothetical protein
MGRTQGGSPLPRPPVTDRGPAPLGFSPEPRPRVLWVGAHFLAVGRAQEKAPARAGAKLIFTIARVERTSPRGSGVGGVEEPGYRACGRWASLSPNSHSSKATRLTIRASQSLASTRRHEPHCQHRSSRGRLCALPTPTWPHVHAILSIIGAFALGRKSPLQSFLRGLKFGVGEREPRAAPVILARRWHGRDGEAAPSISAHGISSP